MSRVWGLVEGQGVGFAGYGLELRVSDMFDVLNDQHDMEPEQGPTS